MFKCELSPRDLRPTQAHSRTDQSKDNIRNRLQFARASRRRVLRRHFSSLTLAQLFACILFASIPAAQIAAQTPEKIFAGIGRAATPNEVKAWDIDVRPDFKGLPPGKGTVSHGQEVWEKRCENCHGIFGESNEVFTPISGGISKKDIETGKVGSLIDGQTPIRSAFMKVATVSTLWDYVNRAMPWNAPKSLKTDEVYAVVAYMLHLNEIVPADFTLSDTNIAEVQKKMPNRNGMTFNHGLWTAKGKPDVQVVACMKDCAVSEKVSSFLPDYARNAHGNLSEQIRPIAVRGIDTTLPPGTKRDPATIVAKPAVASGGPPVALLNQHACTACHAMEHKTVGPGYAEVTKKYDGQPGAVLHLMKKIKEGGSGVWGSVPMPPHPDLAAADLETIVKWLTRKP